MYRYIIYTRSIAYDIALLNNNLITIEFYEKIAHAISHIIQMNCLMLYF